MNVGDIYNPRRLFYGAMVPNWLMRRQEVSAGAKLCFARLAQFAGENGKCFPKQETLALELGCKDRQVRNYLAELESHGLITREKKGLGQPTNYHFAWHAWSEGGGSLPDYSGTILPSNPAMDCRSTVQGRESLEENQKKPAFQNNDGAISLVKAFRERFPHYRPPADPKLTKKELVAANALLASATANEILDLAEAALKDSWSGNRVRASNLRKVLENFTELRAQFGKVVSQIANVPVLPPQEDKTDAEVWEDWEEYCNICLAEGRPPDESLRPECPRPGEQDPSKMPQDRLRGIRIAPPPPGRGKANPPRIGIG